MAKKSLSDKILKKLNTPKVRDYDIETEELRNDVRSDNEDANSDSDDEREQEEMAKRRHYVDVGKSKIKSTTINLGDKYVGSKVDRSELFDQQNDEEEEEEEEEEESDNILEDVTDSEAEQIEEDSEEDIEEEEGPDSNSDQSELEQESQSESEDEEESFKRTQVSKLIQQEKEQVLSRASNTAKSDALKGYTILKQGSQFDKILDSRIKLQKAIVSANSLPINSEVLEKYQTESSKELIDEVDTKVIDLIEKLTQIRKLALQKGGLIKTEIKVNPKKRSFNEFFKANSELNQLELPLRKTILTKWSNRVQSASGMGVLNQGKFKVLNQSIWNQVNNELNDLDRLVKKTRVNRRGITPLGYKEQEKGIDDDDDKAEDDDEMVNGGLSNIDKTLQSNEYIFDDDDFYRLLLNDMINKKLDQKQANSQAILMLSKNKLQKNYDRMATKGRKLKYTVQDSIVQFEMPKRQQFEWGDDQIDELFAGLMGMKVQMGESDDEDSEQEEDNKHEDMDTFKESGVKLFG